MSILIRLTGGPLDGHEIAWEGEGLYEEILFRNSACPAQEVIYRCVPSFSLTPEMLCEATYEHVAESAINQTIASLHRALDVARERELARIRRSR